MPRPGLGSTPAPHPGLEASSATQEHLLHLVARDRARRRLRTLALAAVAALLAIGLPFAVLAAHRQSDAPSAAPATAPPGSSATPPGSSTAPPASPTAPSGGEEPTGGTEAPGQGARTVRATDPGTGVTAVIGLEPRSWGTHTVLQLRGVKGPLTCSLLAVGVDGRRETVSTWSVPSGGYGSGPGGRPGYGPGTASGLNVAGGSSYAPERIERFEVRTSDGRILVTVGNS